MRVVLIALAAIAAVGCDFEGSKPGVRDQCASGAGPLSPSQPACGSPDVSMPHGRQATSGCSLPLSGVTWSLTMNTDRAYHAAHPSCCAVRC
jgi:hypothetical protein